MNKKQILKKACGKGGPLVSAAKGIERGVGNIASNAVSGYKKGGIVGGLAGAGKGVAQNAISNLKGAGSAIKTTLFGPGVKPIASGVRSIANPVKNLSPKTSIPFPKLATSMPMPKTRPLAPELAPKAPEKYMELVQKRPKDERKGQLKKIIREKSPYTMYKKLPPNRIQGK